MRARISPAALILWRHGYSVAQVGRAMPRPIKRAYASQMIRGDYPMRADLLPTIAKLAGEDVATEVARAVERGRDA